MNATAPDRELLAALRPWLDRAEGLVDRRLADARAHAAAGSLPTAENRLRELTGSLNRHVGDARAISTGRPSASTAAAASTPTSTSSGWHRPRKGRRRRDGRPIMGRDYTIDLVDLVGDAQAGLQSAALAGGGEYLDAWQLGHRDRLVGRVRAGAVGQSNCDI